MGDLGASTGRLSVCKVWDAEYPWDVRAEKIAFALTASGLATLDYAVSHPRLAGGTLVSGR